MFTPQDLQSGVRITVAPTASYGPAKALFDAMKSIGVAASWEVDGKLTGNALGILVGVKPVDFPHNCYPRLLPSDIPDTTERRTVPISAPGRTYPSLLSGI